jgi:hypothetical protein
MSHGEVGLRALEATTLVHRSNMDLTLASCMTTRNVGRAQP